MGKGETPREGAGKIGPLGFTLIMFSMAACLPLFFLGPIAYKMGLSPGEALLGALLGNLAVAVALGLNARAGIERRERFGDQARRIFGRLYKIPVLLRGLVGALWYGVEAFNGALALAMITLFALGAGKAQITGEAFKVLPLFLALYIGLIIVFFRKGVDGIGQAANLAGPALFLYFAWLALWVHGQSRAAPPAGVGLTSTAFLLYLAIQTNWWATVAINISDLSVGARDWRTVWIGALAGLVGGQLLGTYLGYQLALATGRVLPQEIILYSAPGAVAVVLGLLFSFLAPWTTDLSANLPALSDLIEELFGTSQKRAAIIAGLLGFILAPWYLLGRAQDIVGYVTSFASSYGVILGPILGAMLAAEYLPWKARNTGLIATASMIIGILVSYAYSIVTHTMETVTLHGVSIPFPGSLSWFIGVTASIAAYAATIGILPGSRRTPLATAEPPSIKAPIESETGRQP